MGGAGSDRNSVARLRRVRNVVDFKARFFGGVLVAEHSSQQAAFRSARHQMRRIIVSIVLRRLAFEFQVGCFDLHHKEIFRPQQTEADEARHEWYRF